MSARDSTAALSPEAKRALRLQPGVVLIYVAYGVKAFNYTFPCGVSGSGFLYRPDGYLITNGHVVQFANVKDPQARQAFLKSIYSCVVSRLEDKGFPKAQIDKEIKAHPDAILWENADITVVLDNGSKYKGEIKEYSDPITAGGKDVAIIKIDGKNLPTVPLGHSEGIKVGEEVSVIGYPGAANLLTSPESAVIPTVTNGRISAVNKTLESNSGTPVLQSEVAITHGNSGGPEFDAKGNAIGIATYGSQEAAGLNFFVPINTAWEFVRQAGAEPKQGDFDAAWSEALDLYAARHWSKAHAALSSVLEMLPNQPDALKLRQEAQIKMPEERWYDNFSSPMPMVIGGGLIVAAIGIVILLFVLRPSKQVPAMAGGPQMPGPIGAPGFQAPPAIQGGAAAGVAPAPALGELHITSGPLKGKQYPIPKGGLLIGRDPQKCVIVLPEDNVGREHAWVMPMDDGRVALIDRGSANGTYLNSTSGEPVRKAMLQNGDRIFICRDNGTEIVYYRS